MPTWCSARWQRAARRPRRRCRPSCLRCAWACGWRRWRQPASPASCRACVCRPWPATTATCSGRGRQCGHGLAGCGSAARCGRRSSNAAGRRIAVAAGQYLVERSAVSCAGWCASAGRAAPRERHALAGGAGLRGRAAAARWQEGTAASGSCAAGRWQEALGLRGRAATARWQECDHSKRQVRARRWQEAQGLRGAVERHGQGPAHLPAAPEPVAGGRRAGRRALDLGVVTPPIDPCYLPDPDLVFWDTTQGPNLVFICDRHSDGPAAVVVVPTRRIYMVLNEVALRRVDGDLAIVCPSLQLSADVDSWTWGWSASVPASRWPSWSPAAAARWCSSWPQ
jgi:hypothetical protein